MKLRWMLAIFGITFFVIPLRAVQIEELRIPFADAPVAVQKTLKREAFAAEIKEVFKGSENANALYQADVSIDGKKYEILVAADGTLLEKEWEEEDETLALADCPRPVQKGLQREAFGAKITSVEKELVYGRVMYEADATIDGKTYEIKVTPDGVLVSKKLTRPFN